MGSWMGSSALFWRAFLGGEVGCQRRPISPPTEFQRLYTAKLPSGGGLWEHQAPPSIQGRCGLGEAAPLAGVLESWEILHRKLDSSS